MPSQTNLKFKEYKDDKSHVLSFTCTYCGKVVRETSAEVQGKYRIAKLVCGHTYATEMTDTLKQEMAYQAYHSFISQHSLRPFQLEDVVKAEKTGGTFLLGHEMGLGKTPMALVYMFMHPEKFPCLIICKSKLKWQWYKQILEWCGPDYGLVQVIDKGFSIPLVSNPTMGGKNWKFTIISFDMLRRLAWGDDIYSCFETVIIDECQHISNPSTWRSAEVRKISKKVKNVIAASGTAVKNNAGEYFTVLNIMHPERFPDFKGYLFRYVDTWTDGYRTKIGGIRNDAIESFDKVTEDFIFRRLRADVMPELPLIDRQFMWSELGEVVEKAYNDQMEMYLEEYDKGGGVTSKNFTNLLAYINAMRQITGIAKVEPVVDYVAEFLMQTNEKLVIFLHHEIVKDLLVKKLQELCKEGGFNPPILYLATGKQTEQQQEDAKEAFIKDPANRIMVASTLASGEGVDGLQYACSKCILMERQWNPANEEQCEARFPRPGSVAQSIIAAYFCAIGTIDEWFTELVERKREYMKATLDGEESKWDESSLMKELMTVIADKGRALVTPQKKLNKIRK